MKLRTTPIVLALVLGMAGIAHSIDIERDWSAMLATLDELEARRVARPTERPALYGETVDGLAREHYARAFEALRSVEDALDHRQRARAEFDAELRGDLVRRTEPLFEHLRRGAHARDAATTIAWKDGAFAELSYLREVRAIAELAVLRAEHLIDRGDDAAAVDTILDAQQLARDLAVSPVAIEEIIGVSELATSSLCRFLAEGGAARMSGAEQRRWLRGIERLEASIPRHSESLRGEVELFARTFVGADVAAQNLEASLGERGDLWRFRFSPRLAIADHVRRTSGLVDDFEDAFDAPPIETRARLRAICLEHAEDPNPLVRSTVPRLESVGVSRLWCLGKLAFLRHALALHLGEPTETPADPFGSGVHVEEGEDGVRVWADPGTADGRVLEVVVAR